MSTKKSAPKRATAVEAELVDEPKTTQALAVIADQGRQLATIRDPEVVLAEATKCAKALIKVISQQPEKKRVIMNGETYITFDGWQLIGNFYGCVPKIADDKLVTIDMGDGKPPVIGYESTADLIHIATGNVLSSAKAMCLNDEPKWSEKNKYVWMYVCIDGSLSEQDPGFDNIVWEDTGVPKNDGSGKNKHRPKKQRTLIGTERVPLFQLRSMSQTRACAKVLRDVFSHVVILAGFSPTPAEEMTGDPDPEHVESTPQRPPETKAKPAAKGKSTPHAKAAAPAKSAEATPPPPAAAPTPPATVKKLSQAQVRRFWMLARTNNWSNEQVHAMILKEAGVDHTEQIPQEKGGYDRICDNILLDGPSAYFQGRA